MVRRLFLFVVMTAMTVPVFAADEWVDEAVLELPHLVNEIMRQWDVPGTAVAVVQDGTVVFSGGFGTGDVKSGSDVTADTIFAVGSTTKGFTSAAVSMLVDEGSVKLDQPVRAYLTDFKLQDSYATAHLTVRDLLAHRSGMKRNDAMWYRSDASREELIGRLKYIQSSGGLRETFLYNNLMYMVAGRVVGKVTGGTWEGFIQRRILEPLAMSRSRFGTPLLNDPDVAAPHGINDRGETVRWAPYTGWAIAPASGIYSTANDMARWLQFVLSEGSVGDRRLISSDSFREMFTPQMALPVLGPRETPFSAYGLGWFVDTYRGRLMVWHTGSIDGYYAMVALLPSDGLGVVILTNRTRHHLPEVVSRWVFDRFLGLPEINWQERYRLQEDAVVQATADARAAREMIRKPDTTPSMSAAQLEGRYRHPAYDDMEIGSDDNGMTASFHGMLGPLEHFHEDAFIYLLDGYDLRDEFIIRFQYASDGSVTSLAASMENDAPPVVFLRMQTDDSVLSN